MDYGEVIYSSLTRFRGFFLSNDLKWKLWTPLDEKNEERQWGFYYLILNSGKDYNVLYLHNCLISCFFKVSPFYFQQNIHGKDSDQVSSKSILNASNNNNTNNNYNNNTNNNNHFTNTINSGSQVQSAAVVLIKEKNGRYQVAREPFMLEKCVVSQDPDFMEVFELLEWNRESFLIKVGFLLCA